MKNILKRYSGIAALVILLVACDKDFGEYNQSPVTVSTIDPSLLFSTSQVYAASWDPEQMTSYCHAFMQYGWSDFWFGIDYQLYDGTSSRPWNNYYTGDGGSNPGVLKNLEYALYLMKDESAMVNTYAAARAWRVFIYQKLTDLYGDIPYTQAAKAFEGGTLTPAYDTQESIYADFISELRAARDAFDATAKSVQGDQFYGGDITKWKKFTNSLLLRIGMRLIKVDPTRAKALVQEALDSSHGGVMTSNADQPVLQYNSAVPNGFYENLGDQHFLMHNTLVDHMINSHDPRLRIYTAVYANQKTNGDTLNVATADISDYSWDFSSSITANSVSNVARARYDVFHQQTLPFYHFPYAQVEFLIAEAILRGYTTGDASVYFNNGVRAHMETITSLTSTNTITSGDIDAYLTNNPLTGTDEEKIEQINTEFWVSGFIFQADEVWANWRRTGYPALTPNPKSITSGTSNSPGVIPRKMAYPQAEFTYNATSLNDALAAYGGANDFNPKARVWWDTE